MESDEYGKTDEQAATFVGLVQSVLCLVDNQHIAFDVGRCDFGFQQIPLLEITSAFQAAFTARVLDENPPHRLGGSGKEMTAGVPLMMMPGIDKPNKFFMH